MMNMNAAGLMEEMTKTSEKLVKGYELLQHAGDVDR
jgi:hypothetical protein